MYLWFIRYLKGYVEFTLEGAELEDTVNLMRKQRIPVWKLERRGIQMTGLAEAGYMVQVRQCAEKSNARCTVTRERGIPFHLKRFFKRPGLLIGMGLFLTCLLLSQKFVWRIDMGAYDSPYREYLEESLDAHGVRVGSRIASLDLRMLQQEILMDTDELSWLALNLDGTTIKVEASDKDLPPTALDDVPCNIVAKKSGKIIRTNVYKGSGMVDAEDVVYRGDLLVSGLTVDEQGNVGIQHADAEIYAETAHSYTIHFDLKQKEAVYNGKSGHRRFLTVLGIRLPLFINFNQPYEYDCTEEYKPLVLGDSVFDLGITTQNFEYYKSKDIAYSEEEARAIIAKSFQDYESDTLQECEIVSCEDTEKVTPERVSVTRSYLLREDIAKRILLYGDDAHPVQ